MGRSGGTLRGCYFDWISMGSFRGRGRGDVPGNRERVRMNRRLDVLRHRTLLSRRVIGHPMLKIDSGRTTGERRQSGAPVSFHTATALAISESSGQNTIGVPSERTRDGSCPLWPLIFTQLPRLSAPCPRSLDGACQSASVGDIAFFWGAWWCDAFPTMFDIARG